MLLRKLLSIVLYFAIVFLSYGQDCDCESSFLWMKQTFEENDAGFQYVVDTKGQNAYDIHNRIITDKIQSAKSMPECLRIMHDWLTFFRKGHIAIDWLNVDDTVHNEILNIDVEKFKQYLEEKNKQDYEGIWRVEPYTVGIQKIEDKYIGFIIESDIEEWPKGEIKLKIIPEGNNTKSVYYTRNRNVIENTNDVKMVGNNVLKIGYFTLTRMFPKIDKNPQIERYSKIVSAQKPYLEQIDENNLFLRIPSFDTLEKSSIDSILNVNKDKILSTKNLIIDITHNGGGSDGSFRELMPYLYTNPIRTVGVEYRSTERNNKIMLDIAGDTVYGASESLKNWAKGSYDVLEKNWGKFVRLSAAISIDRPDTIYKYPQNVGIIIDDGCASATEQFLLAAKQSKKVKLFGKKTMGALDVSNVHYADSPCKEFRLYYTRSKSYRIPDMAIDDVGIQPDFYIDDTIPEYQWVDYVRSILDYDTKW
jgi:C-terminal processing protease CtpA/Prc